MTKTTERTRWARELSRRCEDISYQQVLAAFEKYDEDCRESEVGGRIDGVYGYFTEAQANELRAIQVQEWDERDAKIRSRFERGLNGDAQDRAAARLLLGSQKWLYALLKSDYVYEVDDGTDTGSPGPLRFDWRALIEAFHQSELDRARYGDEWDAWDRQMRGRYGHHWQDDEVRLSDEDRSSEPTSPKYPWDGASSSQLTILRVALLLCPANWFSERWWSLDDTNQARVAAAFTECFVGSNGHGTLPPRLTSDAVEATRVASFSPAN